MSSDPKPLIAGNWKMNGLRQSGQSLVEAIIAGLRGKGGAAGPREARGCDILLCPPATLLGSLSPLCAKAGLAIGGQDCHSEAKGAHTGDISAAMLADLGCSHVIVGHSERRAAHGESNEIVRAKTSAAHKAGLTAVLCVGESAGERESGKTLDIVKGQLAGSLPPGSSSGNTVIAYEPVWAIGSGRTPSLGEVEEVHAAIRGFLASFDAGGAKNWRILYGGSVTPKNAPLLLKGQNVNGALVGGASLAADDFCAIASTCL